MRWKSSWGYTWRIFLWIKWWKNFENLSTFKSYYQTSRDILFWDNVCEVMVRYVCLYICMCVAFCLCDVFSFLFHYVAENSIIYLCVTDDVSCFMWIWNLIYLAYVGTLLHFLKYLLAALKTEIRLSLFGIWVIQCN